MPQTEESTLTASLTNKEASQDLNCNVKSVTDNSDNSFKTRMMKFESMMRPGISSQGNNITKTLRNTNQEARNHFPASDPSRPIRRQASGHVTPLDQSEARHHDRRKTISFPASFALSMTDTGQDSRLTFWEWMMNPLTHHNCVTISFHPALFQTVDLCPCIHLLANKLIKIDWVKIYQPHSAE